MFLQPPLSWLVGGISSYKGYPSPSPLLHDAVKSRGKEYNLLISKTMQKIKEKHTSHKNLDKNGFAAYVCILIAHYYTISHQFLSCILSLLLTEILLLNFFLITQHLINLGALPVIPNFHTTAATITCWIAFRTKRYIYFPSKMRDMYNPRVITIASGKGGTGKTTATANLGTSLALLGKKTIILDADIAMANLALILGMEKSKVTLHEVLAGEADIKDSMYKGPGGVIVVPCGVSLSGFQKSNPERLQDVMIELLKGTEFLLIDAPAGLSRDGVIPLAVADEVILVVNPEISSMADALKTKIMTEMVGSRVSGAILNRANFEKTDLSMREVEKILGVKILEVIPEDPEVRRSTAFKTPIVIRSEDSPAAVAYRRLASKMVGERFVEPEAEREEGVVGRFVRSIFGE